MRSKNEQCGIALSVLIMFCAVMLSGCGSDDSKSDESKKIEKGDAIEFGGRSWLVLAVEDGKALILSEKVIGPARHYYDTNMSVVASITWANSTIREYLNTEFLNSFNQADRERILDTKVITSNNPLYDTDGGEDTVDKIFLLSLEEVVQYFGDSGELKNRPDQISRISDQYNFSRIVYYDDNGKTSWWLRSPGKHSSLAAFVEVDGSISVGGNAVHGYDGGMRPALWLKIEE